MDDQFPWRMEAHMFKSRWHWKLILAGVALNTIAVIVRIDFTSPSRPEWSLFGQDELPTTIEMYGAKAAILAIVGAATLFIAFIPTDNSRVSRIVDLLVRIVGAVAVATMGWFWLLSVTNGSPTPYIVAIVPASLLFVLGFAITSVIRYAYSLDTKQKKETGRAKLGWETVIMALVLLLVFVLTLGTIAYLPSWLF